MRNNSIDLTSLLLQIMNLEMLFKDFNNTDLMNELQKIIKQNEEIIRLLKGGKNGTDN